MGFGGIPRFPKNPSNKTSHCFPLSGENWEVDNLDGLMKAYDTSLKHVGLSGPTNFTPVIQQFLEHVSKSSPKNYHILLILTDGEAFDMDDIISTIVVGSKIPISIIIVGIGNSNFEKMEVLDCDKGRLRDRFGNTVVRDCVQFVEFSAKFKGNAEKLAKQVLGELPKQISQYKTLKL